MSLVNETGFATATTLTSAQAFFTLFKGNTTLTDASQLLLPATTLTNYCYQNMFYGCTKLNSVTCLATDISATSATATSLMLPAYK